MISSQSLVGAVAAHRNRLAPGPRASPLSRDLDTRVCRRPGSASLDPHLAGLVAWVSGAEAPTRPSAV
jgi:hypothetical protein